MIRVVSQTLTGEGSPESQFCLEIPPLCDKTGGTVCVSLGMEQQDEEDLQNFLLLLVRPEELEKRY